MRGFKSWCANMNNANMKIYCTAASTDALMGALNGRIVYIVLLMGWLKFIIIMMMIVVMCLPTAKNKQINMFDQLHYSTTKQNLWKYVNNALSKNISL